MGRLKAMPSRLSAPAPKLRAAPKVAEHFYQSKEWLALKAAKRRLGRVWCVMCGSADRLILDHVVERKDGGDDLDIGNTQWLCNTHHQQKTAAAKARRARGGGL